MSTHEVVRHEWVELPDDDDNYFMLVQAFTDITQSDKDDNVLYLGDRGRLAADIVSLVDDTDNDEVRKTFAGFLRKGSLVIDGVEVYTVDYDELRRHIKEELGDEQ